MAALGGLGTIAMDYQVSEVTRVQNGVTYVYETRRDPDGYEYEEATGEQRPLYEKSHVMIGVAAFTVGEVFRNYGGPEEGGWWYDQFGPRRVIIVPRRKAARVEAMLQAVVDRRNEGRRPLYSVLSDGLWELRRGVCGPDPVSRPHYE